MASFALGIGEIRCVWEVAQRECKGRELCPGLGSAPVASTVERGFSNWKRKGVSETRAPRSREAAERDIAIWPIDLRSHIDAFLPLA